ncbi:hypothetical protein [Microcoleus sp. FACHB-831]|uniref:hypothetical protein n=1 Tax=Microcoleus sp. FACHB-831 TaxID=2692827 RepID=UPI00168A3CA2|nr:hypothetical protein [Microcoleus sp. FACHB-831]
MAPKHNNIKFPFWQFLDQPVFSRTNKVILNPRRFWYLYTITLLERCLAKECASKHRNP